MSSRGVNITIISSQLLNVSKRTLQTYRAKGILGATQINRKTYFRLSEVKLLMQGERPLKKQKK